MPRSSLRPGSLLKTTGHHAMKQPLVTSILGIEKELDNKKIMLEVQRELYASFQETKSMPLSHKKVEMLGTLARSLARIDERVQAGDTALQETLKKFEKFKVVSNRSQLPTLHDLAKQGSVSNRSKSEIDQTREN